MSSADVGALNYDVFLSHGSPDKPWVRTLRDELANLGLKAFLDESELEAAENWTLRLSRELLASRALALVISAETLKRPWVEHEWTSFLAEHGPTSGRLIPVLLDSVSLPTFLKPIQAIKAGHRDAARIAQELAAAIGRYESLPEGDSRRLFIGQDLVFVLERLDAGVAVTDPTGRRREVPAPWSENAEFSASRILFDRLSREAVKSDADRADLERHGSALGGLLFHVLFDETALALLRDATIAGRARPLITVRSDDVMLLSLPWELIRYEGEFLVRSGKVDLVRTDASEVGSLAVLRPPTEQFKLVVNVSAPEGSGLDYEHESYRITLALTAHCLLTPTELGTLDDLVETVLRTRPTGIHFSGHGGPGVLQFEDDEGRGHAVGVGDLLDRLRGHLPDGVLPPFFYLANCHGNDPAAIASGQPGVESLAATLHGAGVAQVVAYRGPILDVLSTEAEAALYGAIADGHTTRYAVRQAREALGRAIGASRSVLREVDTSVAGSLRESFPFAWSQLVLYHRGPDHPLSKSSTPAGKVRLGDESLRRTFVDAGTRRILSAGFIGRRTELHRLRRKVREGQRVFVLQGLGGLGKSTLALYTIREILHAGDDLCTLWCQDAEKAETADGIAEALVSGLAEHGRGRFGSGWENVVHQVDRAAGAESAARFGMFLQVVAANADRLVVYLDNLESLLIGPSQAGGDPDAFGRWRTPALEKIWKTLTEFAEHTGKVVLVASCRYRNDDFGRALIPVGPLPAGALFRLMGWFPGLRRLSVNSRARLAVKLDGHPRAVEFANDLIAHAIDAWEARTGRDWKSLDDGQGDEWSEIVEPALPKVAGKLADDLLFDEIWDHVLDDRARRMLYRMTILRRPWDVGLDRELGEADEPGEIAEATAQRLRRTSLVEQVELRLMDGLVRHETVHPATVEFVARRFGDDSEIRRKAHGRVGAYYEAKAETSRYIDDDLEAGHHLLSAGEYDRAYDLLGTASEWLQHRGRVRQGLQVLVPLLAETAQVAMTPDRVGRLQGTVGSAYYRLGQVEQAVEYYEKRLVIAREIGDRRGEGNALGNSGLAYADLGQVERAIECYEKQLVIAREMGDRRGEGNALGNLGVAYALLRQIERAIEYFEKGLVIDREIGDRRGEGADLGNLGSAYLGLGQVERAIECYEERLVIAREIGDRQGEGYAMGNLARAYAGLGQAERAIEHFEKRLVIAREIGDRRGEGNALCGLGGEYARLGQVERTIGLLEQAERIGEEIKDPRIIEFTTAQLKRLRGGDSADDLAEE